MNAKINQKSANMLELGNSVVFNFIQRLENDSAFREIAITNPEEAMSGFSFTETERQLALQVIEALKNRFTEEMGYIIDTPSVLEKPVKLAFRSR